ncbi:Uncharacterised protein [Mycobacterium tuberculosis]|nr:Uncharacterised protein [Mycobacterium tuberculosis]
MASARHGLSASALAAIAIDSGDAVDGDSPLSVSARRHSAARSRAPSRHRGPVSTRIAAAPAVGSATRRSMATTSATSGMDSRPASPTTSAGIPRARRVSAIAAASALRRTSTAAVGGLTPSASARW